MQLHKSAVAFLLLALLQQHAHSYFLVPLNTTDDNNCGIGQDFRNGQCRSCLPGTYRFLVTKKVPTRALFQCLTFEQSYEGRIEPSTTKCEKCPSGSYNPYHGVVSGTRCFPCPTGSVSKPGAKACTKCPTGKSSAFRSTTCARCPKGSFLTEPCSYGRPKRLCSKCPRGFYSDTVNTLKCLQCPSGHSTALKGATSKSMCKPCGSNGVKCSCRQDNEPWNEVSSYRPIGSAECIRCPPGTRARNPFATKPEQCKPCPANYVYSLRQGCKKCPDGKKTFGLGDEACREKKEDPCPENGFLRTSAGICQSCPPGYIALGGRCQLCPEGSWSEGFLATKCNKCKFPTVAKDSRTRGCECTRNYFKDPFTQKCLACPEGTRIDLDFHSLGSCEVDCEANPNDLACIECGPNSIRDVMTKQCKKCQNGLISAPDGRNVCVRKEDGCIGGTVMHVTPSRFGWAYTCAPEGQQSFPPLPPGFFD